MDIEKYLNFINRWKKEKFYQPVIFQPGVIEVRGKWHEATIELCDNILNDINGRSVLDLGCSYGYFLHEALKKGATKATGIDYDVISIQIGREVSEILNDGAIITCDDINCYIPEEPVDVILMLNIMHVLPDPIDTLNRYIPFAKYKLVIEHDLDAEIFKKWNNHTEISPRAAGSRNLTTIFL